LNSAIDEPLTGRSAEKMKTLDENKVYTAIFKNVDGRILIGLNQNEILKLKEVNQEPDRILMQGHVIGFFNFQ
jgi:hypothetical protein